MKHLRLFCIWLPLVLFFVTAGFAQSSDQNFPTRVTNGTVEGTIKARDIGDSRLTTHYYLIQGARGDVFLNIVTNNINGSIDVFSKVGLKPRTKITLFAEDTATETGRVIYLRQSEQLILRIQGRSPNDDDGTYQLKFAGAFRALNDDGSGDDPFGESNASGSVRVNSAGAIIKEKREDVEQTVSENRDDSRDNTSAQTRGNDETAKSQSSQDANRRVRVIGSAPKTVSKAKTQVKKQEVDSSSGEVAKSKSDPKETQPPRNETAERPKASVRKDGDNTIITIPRAETPIEERDEVKVEITKEKPKRSAIVRIERSKDEKSELPTEAQKLKSTNLVIEFTNGRKFVRPMNDVLKFSVDEGKFTVITKDGFIRRFSILEVSKVSIEPNE